MAENRITIKVGTGTVEKMAKIMCLADDDGVCRGKCDKNCNVWKRWMRPAKAGIKALLEAKDEK